MRPGSAGIVARSVVECGGQLAVGAQLWCRALWWTLFAGPLVACRACVTQLQLELFTPRAQVAAESGLADAV